MGALRSIHYLPPGAAEPDSGLPTAEVPLSPRGLVQMVVIGEGVPLHPGDPIASYAPTVRARASTIGVLKGYLGQDPRRDTHEIDRYTQEDPSLAPRLNPAKSIDINQRYLEALGLANTLYIAALKVYSHASERTEFKIADLEAIRALLFFLLHDQFQISSDASYLHVNAQIQETLERFSRVAGLHLAEGRMGVHFQVEATEDYDPEVKATIGDRTFRLNFGRIQYLAQTYRALLKETFALETSLTPPPAPEDPERAKYRGNSVLVLIYSGGWIVHARHSSVFDPTGYQTKGRWGEPVRAVVAGFNIAAALKLEDSLRGTPDRPLDEEKIWEVLLTGTNEDPLP